MKTLIDVARGQGVGMNVDQSSMELENKIWMDFEKKIDEFLGFVASTMFKIEHCEDKNVHQ